MKEPTVDELEAEIKETLCETVDWVMSCKGENFHEFEQALILQVIILGQQLVGLFVCMREEQASVRESSQKKGYKNQGSRSRLLGTVFGKVEYWRTYLYSPKEKNGYYPLDIELGLSGDGFSLLVQSYATRMATKMSYAQAELVLSLFLQWSPGQKSIEEMVLGVGKYTNEWFESAPAPENDGDVLIIQIDSKAAPTATEAELEKRRGPRPANPYPGSARHRGREKRRQQGTKPRRKKGDKSKNGKMATIVVMYTLKTQPDGKLTGPINKKVYASYAPKRHAVAAAHREADKRGFGPTSGKLIQIVTDGDNDLERYSNEFFPNAIHTIDVFHVTEYLWDAANCLFREGSHERTEWVSTQKNALHNGQAQQIIDELDAYLETLSNIPALQNKHKRLTEIRSYLHKRLDKIDYLSLRQRDLEISSGPVEGAVNHVIAKRFDSGGMRWIKERSEHLLQLRCIEINGDWDAFFSFVHEKIQTDSLRTLTNIPIKSTAPDPLPTFGVP